MKNILLFAALTLALFSCKKKDCNDVTPLTADYFTFGVSGGLCGSCYHYYQIRAGHIYQHAGLSQNGWVFSAVPMSQAKYNIASPLLSSFPTYLLSHKDTSFGCSGCADQQVFYIEILQGDKKTYWNIDDVDQAQPAAIKPYVDQLRAIISELAN